MGADGRTAHDFFSKLMGGKIKKNNGRTMGALPKIWIMSKKIIPEDNGHIILRLRGKIKRNL